MSEGEEDRPPEIVVLTHFASPYQVEFFNEIARSLHDALVVYYLHGTHSTRSWGRLAPQHRAHFFKEEPGALEQALSDFRSARLVVFNYYAESPASELLRLREQSGLPWCFWGERPGYRLSPWIGLWYRKWRLAPLHRAPVPIWGIGKRAVEAYRREFGSERLFCNVPYFSDLRRFDRGFRRGRILRGFTTFLYSGSLTRRKGVDVLARAFVRLAAERPDVRLRLLGDGPLRPKLDRWFGGLGDRVNFVGFRDWDELPGEYAQADILCVPSRHDGWGLVVPEGLAAGMPVISTAETGAAIDLIEPGRNGWIVPAGDAEALQGAMREAAALTDGDLAMRSASAMSEMENHSLERGAENFLRAAEKVLKS